MTKAKLTEEEKEYRLLVANIREVLKTRAGKDVIWHVLQLADLYNVTTVKDSLFREGRRSLGVDLLMLMEEADPTAYPKLLLDRQNLTLEN